MPSAAAIAIMTAAFVTLLVQAALAFQKYRFNSGLMLGTTLAAVNWYEDAARRNGIPPFALDPNPDRNKRRGPHACFAAGSARVGHRLAPSITHS